MNGNFDDMCPSCFAHLNGAKICGACGYNLDAPVEQDFNKLSIGTILNGRYLIGRALGQGGFGITYLGLDLTLGNKLAIKEYYPSGLAERDTGDKTVKVATSDATADFQQGLEKFLEEARTLARFEQNPNIVSVKDFFEQNGTAYMTMNYLEGGTMLEYIRKNGGKISFEEATKLLFPVMDALDVVHASGLIHRDISPDNVFITNDGQVRLLDFGAAKSALALVNQKSHSVVLKKGYSPAEQYQSKGSLGPWSDVYSMGATLYRSITGELPPDAVDRGLSGEDLLEPPSKKGAILPDYAEKAIIRALSLRYTDRFQSMGEFKNALSAPQPEQPPKTVNEPKAPPTVSTPKVKEREHHIPEQSPAKPAQQKKAFPIAAVAAALILIVCGGAYFLMGDKSTTPAPSTTSTAGTTTQENSTSNSGTSSSQTPYDTMMARAQKGDMKAQYQVGVMLQQGRGVPQDTIAAAEWFRKSAEQGYAPAQSDLGGLYVQGNGVPQDYKEAVLWITKAADQEFVHAIANLAWLYEGGYGVEKNLPKAVSLYRKAADKGHPTAQNKMGALYMQGIGVEENHKLAFKYFQKAANNGIADAQYFLGCAYLNGIGVKIDRLKAREWLQKAAEQGHEEALLQLNALGQKKSSQQNDKPAVKAESKPVKKVAAKKPAQKPVVKKVAVKKTVQAPAAQPAPQPKSTLPPGL